MPKKPNLPENESIVVDKELLRRAKLALEPERPQTRVLCDICNAEAAPNSTENLCWVCRRLKISAWRDSDQQVSAPE